MLNKEKAVFCLGYFDCVHLGHREVILRAKEKAENERKNIVVFTFSDNLKGAFYSSNKSVYNFEERKSILSGLGIEEVFALPVNTSTLSLTGEEFLDLININYNITDYFCGEDFKFGVNASCNVEYLKNYAKEHGQTVNVVKSRTYNGARISTTMIKMFLSMGKIIDANECLGREYSVSGKVVKGKQLGRQLGYNTANIDIDTDKFTIKEGVYSGYSFIDGKKYSAIINYGKSATLDEKVIKTEAHFLDFDGDLYGKNIEIFFTGYIRDIVKFGSLDELKSQLAKDKAYVRSIK